MMENIQQPHLMMCDRLPLPGSGEKKCKKCSNSVGNKRVGRKSSRALVSIYGGGKVRLPPVSDLFGSFFSSAKTEVGCHASVQI